MNVTAPQAAAPHGATSAAPRTSLAAARPNTAEQDFLAYAKMTPGEKMRAAILGSMGLKESDLKAMDPKERQKIEDKIKEIIHEKAKEDLEKKGALADIKA